jgi:poly(ADP-ribose) glycohydrolase ARH3
MVDKKLLKSKFLGALVGTAVGDALGMPVEGYDPKQIQLKYGKIKEMLSGKLPAGSYTDDTEMMIGVAESLIENRGFNGEHMAKTFIKNFDSSRGYGFGAQIVLQLVSEGESWEEAAKNLFGGVGSYGNGAAMRIAPVSIFYYDNFDELKKTAVKTAKITHTHPLGVEGAVLQAYAIALALNQHPLKNLDIENFLQTLQNFVKSEVYKNKIKKIKLLLSKKTSKWEVIFLLGNGIEAFNSVPTAIYSFLANHKSFEDAVTYAVNLGGDTDTLGAMTGAISGAYHGFEAIPKRWLNKLENLDYLKSLAEKIWEIKHNINTT